MFDLIRGHRPSAAAVLCAMSKFFFALFVIASLAISPLAAQTTEKRIALVIGNADYQAGLLQTSANDAGLIAQTLQVAGFDVVGARDLDQDSLRRAFRDFLDKASASGLTLSPLSTSAAMASSSRGRIISSLSMPGSRGTPTCRSRRCAFPITSGRSRRWDYG